MIRKLSVTAVAILLLLVQTNTASASADLMVGPGTITASPAINPGQTVKLPTHEITNNSFRALEMTVSVFDRADDERVLPPAEWFSINPDELIVQARSSAEVQVELVLPDDAPPNEYKVWFRFDSMPIGASGVITAATINVSFTFDVADTGPPEAAPSPEEYPLTVETEGGGGVKPEAGSHTYPVGTVVELLAMSSEVWEFERWDGDVDDVDNPQTSILMDGDREVMAVFTEREPDRIVTDPGDDEPEPDESEPEPEPEEEEAAPTPDDRDDDSTGSSLPWLGAGTLLSVLVLGGCLLWRRFAVRI